MHACSDGSVENPQKKLRISHQTNALNHLDFVEHGLLIVFGALVSCLDGRRLLDVKETKKRVYSLTDSLFLSALPKGTVPSSTPSKKGHAVEVMILSVG
ncbi:precursor of cep14 [Quercus suber]|uniref:Precursor of cep14 n=1 Tax=Quercus suber TaxID=58331 RepID=A0AAW0K4M1_QUESU